ncbi:MAG TPA: hypothetical protein VK588_08380 [Chitinophagaceae bacterium]|nr:hypothetical protein [Chitinophagaceae bacterium]
MDYNIIEVIQKNLGYEPLKKADPNTQEIIEASKMTPEQRLSQAAIPAVLAAMIKYSDGPEGVNLFSENKDWLGTIYSGKENDAIRKVADYSGMSTEVVELQMENISDEAVRIIKETVKNGDAEKLRSFLNGQRHSVLSHLPATLKMGDFLNEETFDDRTNKMEGPVSGFLHRIENII